MHNDTVDDIVNYKWHTWLDFLSVYVVFTTADYAEQVIPEWKNNVRQSILKSADILPNRLYLIASSSSFIFHHYKSNYNTFVTDNAISVFT